MKKLNILAIALLYQWAVNAQTVVAVHDADTYKILLNGKIETVRLNNVDAPETGQYYGTNARDSVADLLMGQTVDVEAKGTDLYGRLLANLRIKGRSLDSLLVAKGWAWNYAAYSHKPQLIICESIARANRSGMWQCPDNLAPWQWRKLSKEGKKAGKKC